ncbi:MAG: dephospho-CoA kinase [Deltaproteobacteria bacterium]|jgi:dephospho-CoA kinase|nr:dephospho-CoA kinase [Deltaproteobacteria bacterium]
MNYRVIGLTGQMGTGKSTILQLLAQRGAQIVEADLLAREVSAPGSRGLRAIMAQFGEKYIDDAGLLRRNKLGRLVFSDPEARGQLEAIVHPLITNRLQQLIAQGPWPLIYEAPLLFAAGHHRFCDLVVATISPPQLQKKRIQQRDGLTLEEIENRLGSQLSQEQLQKKADFIIFNDGDMDKLEQQVDQLWQLITGK